MTRVNPLFPAINAGEFSPRMAARVDFNKYILSGSRLENFLVQPQGGIARRPGTLFIHAVEDAANKHRLLSYAFSTDQTYVLEAGNGFFHFFRNKAQISVPETDAVIVNGTFDTDINGWDDVSTGSGSALSWDSATQRMNLDGSAGGTARAEQGVPVGASFQNNEHVLRFDFYGAAGDQITLQVGTTSGASDILNNLILGVGFHSIAFTPGVATFFIQFFNKLAKTTQIDNVSLMSDAPFEVGTPYGTDDLFALKTAAAGDIMYIGHPDYPIMKLERRGETTWSLVEVAWQDGPYLTQNTTSTTLLIGAGQGAGVQITASSVDGINGDQGFLPTDVGRLVRAKNTSGEFGWAIIVGWTSSTVVTADIRATMPGVAVSAWALGAWSETTGYPVGVTFFEQRLFAWSTRGGIDAQPQTFWASQSADIENMSPDTFDNGIEVQDDDAFEFTVAAEEVNFIEWMSPGAQLIFGTTGGEWSVRSVGASLTPTDVDVKRSTTHGSHDISPVRISNVVLFLDRGQRHIREFAFIDLDQDFRAPDLTELNDIILSQGKGIAELAYAEDPDSILYAPRNDGQMAAMTYLRQQGVVSWSRQIFGGSFQGGIAEVESVAVITGNEEAGTEFQDEVWVIVKRTIDGATTRYVEVMEPAFEGPVLDFFDTKDEYDTAMLAVQAAAHYVDAGVIYDDVPTMTITGLDHLEGETVKVWADGAIFPDAVVSGGEITLTTEVSKAHVGLGYTHKYKGFKIDAGAVAGTAIGKNKRISKITFILMNSVTLSQGPSFDDTIENDFRIVADAMDTGVPLFTGEHPVEFDGDWGQDVRIVVTGDDPAPFILLGMAPEMITNDLS